MTERRKFEFLLLRYVPNAVRERYVDFGVVLLEKGNETRPAMVRFAPHWKAVLKLDPQADVNVLEALEREITAQLASLGDREVLLRWLEDSYSNVIQVSARRPCLGSDPEQEIEILAKMYLSEPEVLAKVERKETGRRQILNVMQTEFERVGVWGLLIHGVPVAQYTRPDDEYKFDFGYRLGNELKIFHAVSLKGTVDRAIEVASKYSTYSKTTKVRADFVPLLTTIIEDNLHRSEERVSYTLEAMGREGIQIAELQQMPQIAKQARNDLGV